MPLLENVRYCESANMNIDLFYDEVGDPAAPALVLIAGVGAQMVSWHKDFCQQLAHDGPFRVIRFDNRDTGFSSKCDHLGQPSKLALGLPLYLGSMFCPNAAEMYTLEDMALDVVALLDALHIDKAHILGMCQGGAVAQWMYLVAPHRMLSLINLMTSTGGHGLSKIPMWIQKNFFMVAPTSSDLEDVLDSRVDLLCRCHFPKGGPSDEARAFVREHSRVALERCSYRGGGGRQMLALFHSPPREYRLRLAAAASTSSSSSAQHQNDVPPVAIIHGAGDRQFPLDHAHRMADIWKTARRTYRLHVVARMGHFLEPAVWDEVISFVSEFSREQLL